MIEENLALPFLTQVLGQEVTVAKIDITKRDEIVAICSRGKVTQAIPILDLPMPGPGCVQTEFGESAARMTNLANKFASVASCN